MATCTDLYISLKLEDTLRGSRQHYLVTYMFGGRFQEYKTSLLNTSYHTPVTPNPPLMMPMPVHASQHA